MSKFKFDPDKMSDTGTLPNGKRATAAAQSINHHELATGARKDTDFFHLTEHCQATDLVANIGHLCDREGWDFETVLHSAKVHWQHER